MRILGVIPARGGSKRIKDKNILNINGKPLIAYTIEAVLSADLIDKCVVSTDDPKIAEAARKCGIDIIMRPGDLACDNSAIDDALRHAVRHLEDKDEFHPDIVVSLQANVPIRKSGEIDLVVQKIIGNNDLSAVATAYPVVQRPEWMKLSDPQTGLAKPFVPVTDLYRKQDLPELYLFDGAIIAVRKNVLLKTEGIKKVHAYMGDKVLPIIHETKYAVEIDEVEDLKLAAFYLTSEVNLP